MRNFIGFSAGLAVDAGRLQALADWLEHRHGEKSAAAVRQLATLVSSVSKDAMKLTEVLNAARGVVRQRGSKTLRLFVGALPWRALW